jgi:hypothetical protein
MEDETIVTNDYGIRVRRIHIILEDGLEIIEDHPLGEVGPAYHPQATAPSESEIMHAQEYPPGNVASGYRPQATAPSESYRQPTIPIVHATALPVDVPTTVPPTVSESAGTATGTTLPQVNVVQGPAPPQAYQMPPSRYVYRDERTGVCVVCGLSFLACFWLCCCCVLPVILVPIGLVIRWYNNKSSWDDDYIGDVYDTVGDDNITRYFSWEN